ncbi:MAG TPA: hypothetical protein VFL34_00005 [Candidatus Sulfotelmatobacter sp.]|nr:hypothetical protein [Candidatus Sulfotelmatobacter sp.]
MDAVGERTNEFISQSTREIIDDLGDRVLAQDPARKREHQKNDDDKGVDEETLPDPCLADIRIVCIPARDEADELVGMMFSQILRQAGYSATYLAIGTVEDMLQQVGQGNFRIACVSALPPFAVGQARSLCKRLHSRFPDLTIMIGLWDFAGGVIKAQERVGSNCGHSVATSLAEGLLQVRRVSALDAPQGAENSESGREYKIEAPSDHLAAALEKPDQDEMRLDEEEGVEEQNDSSRRRDPAA